MRRLPAAVVSIVGAVMMSLVATPAGAAPSAPSAAADQTGALKVSPHSYIVKTKSSSASLTTASSISASGGRVINRYSRVFHGFSAELTPQQATSLRSDPQVVAVTPDAPTHAATVQTNPPWGLDRIDQRTTNGDGAYDFSTTGAGVTVFVIDTGIRFTHAEFGGRAISGYDFVDKDSDASDCFGHGTHVSGTTGGTTYGVAKNVHYISLRVWDCNGSGWMSDMIAALDWAIAHKPAGPSVVNISGGGAAEQDMDDAVSRTVAAGIPVVVAAMNEDADACDYSPARAPMAITVGATDSTDTRAYFSDYGSCVDLFAPGVSVLSSVNTSDTAAEYWSGTSMATPHVTGIVARYLQGHPTATPSAVTAAILADATPGIVTDPAGSPNRLAYIAPPAAAPGAPTSFTITKNDTAKTGTITWKPPTSTGGSPITGYRVARDGTDSTGKGPWSATIAATARSQTFTNLKPGSTYTLSVKAINAAGYSPPANGKITMAAVAPSAPTSFTVTKNDTAKTGTITWKPPTSTGGSPITGYRVARDGTDSTGKGPWSATVPATARSQTFTNLKPGSTYTLSVKAINAKGYSPPAAGKVTMK